MKPEDRLPLALFSLRLGVFVVFFIWTVDKLLRPEHVASIFERYYFLTGLGREAMCLIGAVEILLILGFLLGLANCYTYGAVLILHAISIVGRVRQIRYPVRGPQSALLRRMAHARCLLRTLRSARFRHVVDHQQAPLTSARYSRQSLSPLIATPPR